MPQENAIFYVMEEPSLEDDYERWAAWYDGVKASRDVLLAALQARDIRPLPPATVLPELREIDLGAWEGRVERAVDEVSACVPLARAEVLPQVLQRAAESLRLGQDGLLLGRRQAAGI